MSNLRSRQPDVQFLIQKMIWKGHKKLFSTIHFLKQHEAIKGLKLTKNDQHFCFYFYFQSPPTKEGIVGWNYGEVLPLTVSQLFPGQRRAP